jgi:hypothetical protein
LIFSTESADGECAAAVVVGVVAVGDDGAETVVAAGELDDDENAAVLAGSLLRVLGVRRIGQRHYGLVEEGGDRRGDGQKSQALLQKDAAS